jgi:hypothetical protein
MPGTAAPDSSVTERATEAVVRWANAKPAKHRKMTKAVTARILSRNERNPFLICQPPRSKTAKIGIAMQA